MRLGTLLSLMIDDEENIIGKNIVMNNVEFLHIVNSNLDLTAQGLGIKNDGSTDFETERQNAYSLFNKANICENWLAQCSRTKTIRKTVGNSYDIVQKFDKWYKEDTGHKSDLTIGALLIAAHHLGISCVKKGGSNSFYMNISNRRKIDERWLNRDCLS